MNDNNETKSTYSQETVEKLVAFILEKEKKLITRESTNDKTIKEIKNQIEARANPRHLRK